MFYPLNYTHEFLERLSGIEPELLGWKPSVLPSDTLVAFETQNVQDAEALGVLLAEAVGFEPTEPLWDSTVFKTVALNHSATLPLIFHITL